MMTRGGTQALTPEEVAVPRRYHDQRHPQTGKFIRSGSAPVKKGGARPAGRIPVTKESK